MSDKRKHRLIDLGAEVLADALLELTIYSETADDLVERLIATPDENIERFKAKLNGLKHSRQFVHWNESTAFARELEALLQDLKAGVDDPEMGSEMMAAFYETDEAVFENCDDSSGTIGDVYRFDAKDLFLDYARRCTDKDRLANLVLDLNRDDNYGVRDTLIDCAAEYLPEPNIRSMISRLQGLADKEREEYHKRHWLILVESLARQIKDAPLFEKTRIASWGKLTTAACVDIAKVYNESGDAKTALAWLERIPEDEARHEDERDRLLVDIYGQLGEREKQSDAAWRIFRIHRSGESLQELLSVIGDEHRDRVLSGEVAAILEDKKLSLTDAAFLSQYELIDELEHYLLDRVEQLNGGNYWSLPPLAQTMEAAERWLAAAVLYRALLNSILKRGKSKAYNYGVEYLKKLDELASSISDWRGLDDHDAYSEQLRKNHGRKYSFWSRYGG